MYRTTQVPTSASTNGREVDLTPLGIWEKSSDSYSDFVLWYSSSTVETGDMYNVE